MYWNERDHPVAHFHAYHAERRALVSAGGEVLAIEGMLRHRAAARAPRAHPIPRPRWQGSPDDWAIGIYRASTGQYSENELPGPFGGATGTPEQGMDETFILYAGPITGN